MIIKGEKVTLRSVIFDDAARLTAWFLDREINDHVLRKMLRKQDIETWITSLPEKKEELHLMVTTQEHISIGCISLKINFQDRHAELALLIGEKEYWGRGFGTQSSRLMIQYAFKKLRMHKVWLGVYAYNTRALFLYHKLGFIQEGILREQVCYKKKYYDEIIMGLLASEWNLS